MGVMGVLGGCSGREAAEEQDCQKEERGLRGLTRHGGPSGLLACLVRWPWGEAKKRGPGLGHVTTSTHNCTFAH